MTNTQVLLQLENYRPVSILPVASKIFETLLCKLLTVFADQNL